VGFSRRNYRTLNQLLSLGSSLFQRERIMELGTTINSSGHSVQLIDILRRFICLSFFGRVEGPTSCSGTSRDERGIPVFGELQFLPNSLSLPFKQQREISEPPVYQGRIYIFNKYNLGKYTYIDISSIHTTRLQRITAAYKALP